MSLLGRVRRRVLGIPARAATFDARGFEAGVPGAREHLEAVGAAFVNGYLQGLEVGGPEVAPRLADTSPELRGFAFEGAAMALALLDGLTPWPSDRWGRFVAGPAQSYAYLAYVGFGWAAARLRRCPTPSDAEHGSIVVDSSAVLHASIAADLAAGQVDANRDPVLGWLAVDGFGFHHGYFDPSRWGSAHQWPAGVTGYSRRACDQGLGRSLWFRCGASPRSIAARIAGQGRNRRADLWSGVGLACAYAGGVPPRLALQLADLSGVHAPWLAQGVAFGITARVRADFVPETASEVCQLIWGIGPEALNAVTLRQLDAELADAAPVDVAPVDVAPVDVALPRRPAGEHEPPIYEHWRRRTMMAWTPPPRWHQAA